MAPIVNATLLEGLHGKERMKAYLRVYRAAKHEHLLAQAKEYREEHKEQVAASKRNSYLKNKAHYAELHAAWKTRNPERRKELNRRYRQAHKLEINRKANEKAKQAGYAQQKEWCRNHPEVKMARVHKRRALKRSVTAVTVDLRAIMLRDRMMCGICHKKVARKDLSFDHIIPLSLGGPHVANNLQVAHKCCNSRRGAGRIPVQMRLGVQL